TAADVPLGPGPDVVLHVHAEDAAGNTTDKTVTVRIDRTAPVVHITSPTAGAYLKTAMVEVTGTALDEGPVQVDVNGQAALVSGGSFSVTLPATEGAFTATATARDAAGNVGTDAVTVNVDTMAPLIDVTAPVAGLVTKADSVEVAGTV